MFEDYKGVIHLEQVIKEKYHYQYEDLITLSSQSFIELEGNGKDALCWIIYDNEKYLFKPLEEADYNVWGELLSEEIAKFIIEFIKEKNISIYDCYTINMLA